MRSYLSLLALCLLIISCGGGKKETPTMGDLTVLTDETFSPMVEEQVQVFESLYRYATFSILVHPEAEISKLLMLDSSRVMVLSRELTPTEKSYFEQKKIIPRSTDLCYDGIALIVNKDYADSVITLTHLHDLLVGKQTDGTTLVFDNPGSSTLSRMASFISPDSISTKSLYSLTSNAEVIKYIAESSSAIGFVGVNWLYRPDKNLQPYVDKVKVLGIQTPEGFSKPTQDNIAAGIYPFTRKIRIINCQGSAGLGLGLAAFMAGDVGQRIILKSGLVPVNFPKREIVIKDKIRP